MTTLEFERKPNFTQKVIYVPFYNNGKWGVQEMETERIRIMPTGSIMYRGWIYSDLYFESESDAWKYIRKE